MSMLRYPPTEIRLTSSETELAGRHQRRFTPEAVHSMTGLMRSTSIRIREGPQQSRDEALRPPLRTIPPRRAVFCFVSDDSSVEGPVTLSSQHAFLPRNFSVGDSSANDNAAMRRVNHRNWSSSQERNALSRDHSEFSGFETTSPSSDSISSDSASPMSLDGSAETSYRGLNAPSSLQLLRQKVSLPRSPLYQTQEASSSPTTRQPSNESNLLSRGLHQPLSSVPTIEVQRLVQPIDSSSRHALGSHSSPDLRVQGPTAATNHSAISVISSPIPEGAETRDKDRNIDTQDPRTKAASSCPVIDVLEELRKHRASPLDYISQIAGSTMSQAPTLASLQGRSGARPLSPTFRFPSFSTQESSDSDESSEIKSDDEDRDVEPNEPKDKKPSLPVQSGCEKATMPKATPRHTPATFKPYNDAISPSQQPQTPASHLLHRRKRGQAFGSSDRPSLSGSTPEISAISEASLSTPSSPSPSPRRGGSNVLQSTPDEQAWPISAPLLPPPVIQSAQAQQQRNVSAEDTWLQQQRNLNDLMRQQRRPGNPLVDPRLISHPPPRHHMYPPSERFMAIPLPPGAQAAQHVLRRPRERPLVPPHIPPRLSPRGSVGHMQHAPIALPRPRPSDPQIYHPASRQTQFRPIPPMVPRQGGPAHPGLSHGIPPQQPWPHVHLPPHHPYHTGSHPPAQFQHQPRYPTQHFQRPSQTHGQRQQPRPRQQDQGEPRHQQENSDDTLLQTLQDERARFIARQGQQMAEVRRGQMERTPPPGEGRLERYLRN